MHVSRRADFFDVVILSRRPRDPNRYPIQGCMEPEKLHRLTSLVLAWSDEYADYDQASALIAGFGSLAPHDLGHRQSLWFCCLCYDRMRPSHIVMPNTCMTLGMIVQDVMSWMLGSEPPGYLDELCNADLSHLRRTAEPDPLDYIEAIPSLLRFARYAGMPDGVEVLEHAVGQDEYRSWMQSGDTDLYQWSIDHAIPAALNLHFLPASERLRLEWSNGRKIIG